MTATEATAYNYIRRGVARTRAELARVMRVSRPTASSVSESLIASGLLRDGGKCQTSGGRSPTLLIPCPDAFSLIGADLGGSGKLIIWEVVSAPEDGKEPETIFITLTDGDELKSGVPFALTIMSGAVFK